MRHRILLECPRKYFFRFYAAPSGSRPDATEPLRTLFYLGKLCSRGQWVERRVRQILHTVLECQTENKPSLDENEAISTMLTAMRDDFKNSRSGRYRAEPARHFGLFEFEYDIPVTDAEWKETADLALACIRAFYRLPFWTTWPATQPADILAVSLPIQFDLAGLKVVIPLDLARREKGLVVIHAWDIGKENAHDTFETASCALAAHHKWNVPADRILVERVGLPTGTTRKYQFDDAQLDATRDFIRESADEMLFLLADPKNNIPLEAEEFPTAEDPRICRRCNFLKVCPKWTEGIA